MLVDFEDAILAALREYDPITDSTSVIMPFEEDRPLALPDFSTALGLARSWAQSSSLARANFYSAREEPETPGLAKQVPAKKPAAKRLTMAVLSEQLGALAAQVQVLTESQLQQATAQMPRASAEMSQSQPCATPAAEPTRVPLLVSSPKMPAVSQGVPAVPHRLAAAKSVLGLVGPPPKTRLPRSAPEPSLAGGQAAGINLNAEDPFAYPQDQMLAALSQQSTALTSLVAHLATSGGDPFVDLQGGSGQPLSGTTRGVQRREKMQSDLATGVSQYWLQMIQQMHRRLHPARPVPKSEEEVQAAGVSMCLYLERFGGYRAQKELGYILWILAHVVDAAMSGNFELTKEHLALLVVSIEQAALDSDWTTAYLLSLMEDPPQQVFQDRMQSMTSSRPFSPLVPAAWSAVTLAYLKELEVLSTKKAEVKGKKQQAQSSGGGSNSESASPKRKPRFPKKPKAASAAQAEQ